MHKVILIHVLIKNWVKKNLISDLIAIPDFAAGAMENWGLITYRETAVLYDPKVSSARNKERVAVVIAHELAHQVCLGTSQNLDWYHACELAYGMLVVLLGGPASA